MSVSETTTRGRGFHWALSPRDPGQEHRASTPLELLFDLCFVVAVGQASADLHHALGEGHVGSGLAGYLAVFFAIWWAWMNFSWFASAYDSDDALYRLLTLVQMTGVLVLATGVDGAFASGDFTRMTVGYVIMRIPLTLQWFRAAAGIPTRRQVAVRYAVGLIITQLLWVVRLFLPHGLAWPSFFVLVAAEVAVPLIAERSGPMTPWHPEHIHERYGEFTLIVLGESVLSTMVAAKASSLSLDNVAAGIGAMILLFSIWWAYFDTPGAEEVNLDEHNTWMWGYGHLPIFASVAGLGAGLAVVAEVIEGESHISAVGAAYTVAIPIAVYSVMLAELHHRVTGAFALRVRYIVKSLVLLFVPLLAVVVSLPWVLLLLGLYVGVSLADNVVVARNRMGASA